MTHLCIDSGAYSAFHRGSPIDLLEWIEFCKKVLRKKPDTLVVNLDVIGKKGEDTGEQSYRNWVKMREAGLSPLPVFHAASDSKWLRKYLKLTDYVGLGAIADMITSRRMWALDRIWEDFFIDRVTRMPKFKVHAMGVTSFPLMRRYPWFSIDSTSWLQAGMYGKIFVPHQTNGVWDYTRKPYQMNVSTKSPKLKDKGLHIQNLSPHLRKVLDKYIEQNGFLLGKSKFVSGEEEVLEDGLSTNYYQRCFCNSLFYSRFIGTMPWPRPFGQGKPFGLFDVAPCDRVKEGAALPDDDVPDELDRTRLFFSGEIPVENFMRQRPEEYPNCGIMLTYYTLRQSQGARPARRLRGMIKGRPYKEGTKRAKGRIEA